MYNNAEHNICFVPHKNDVWSKKMSGKIFFVVGNARSGTTMMGRILGKLQGVNTFGELHFYGMIFDPLKDGDKLLSYEEAISLFSRLLCLQRNGFFSKCIKISSYRKEVERILSKEEKFTYETVYTKFLIYETNSVGKSIPCEQTPKNLFYINRIRSFEEDVKIINMMRDPRDILNSQKNKWKRRYLGAKGVPLYEAIRAWFNYHPITIALVWRSSVLEYKKYMDLPELVKLVKFEELLQEPEKEVRGICAFLGMEYDPILLNVPQVGSSDGKDSNEKGINVTRINPWKHSKNLTRTEIYICEKYCKKEMQEFGYEPSGIQPNLFLLGFYYILFPFKMTFALLLNVKRMKNMLGTVERYLFNRTNLK